MKCDRCFFCTHIGAGIYAPYPVKYCKHSKDYKIPFVYTQDGAMRQLDFSKLSELKIWHEAGCGIHPSKVEKAKRDYIKSLEKTEASDEPQ